MNIAGFNPMRWNCEKQGCFNVKRRPKIEAFAGCFPRRINFGDVDGLVEYCGAFCLLEWKGDGGSVGTGQRLSFVQFTKMHNRNIVFVVHGDAETMEIKGYSLFWQGKFMPFVAADLGKLKARISKWAVWVSQMVVAE